MSANISYNTLHKNSIKYLLKFVEEYELVKAKNHPKYKKVREFFKANDIGYQNFYKFYGRFINSNRNPNALLPMRPGPKPKYQELPLADDKITNEILDYRKLGYNRYIIAQTLQKKHPNAKRISASTVYRTLRTYGVSRLSALAREEKRKIVRTHAGSLGHIDCHYLPKGIIVSEPNTRYFVLGVIDDYSRVVWVEVMESIKAIDAAFAMMDVILHMHQRYSITFDEVLTDNGSEFCSSEKNLKNHPFERLLLHFAIKHIKTRPYRPQTNGKIERFWRTFHDEVIEGAVYNTLDELKDAVLGYNFFYNEHRPHQGLDGKIPSSMLTATPAAPFKKKDSN